MRINERVLGEIPRYFSGSHEGGVGGGGGSGCWRDVRGALEIGGWVGCGVFDSGNGLVGIKA